MSFIKKAMRALLSRLYADNTVLLLECKTKQLPSRSIHIEHVTEHNVQDAIFFQPASKIELFKSFLAAGQQGYYAYLQNRCVHRSWVVQGPAKVLLHKFYTIQISPDEVFIQYCETAPDARGKNIFTEVLLHIAQQYPRHRVFTSVDMQNTSSQRSMTKAGFIELYRKRIRVILGVRIID